MVISERKNGKKRVALIKDKYSLNLSIMKNGFQSISFPVDKEILLMLLKVINEGLKNE